MATTCSLPIFERQFKSEEVAMSPDCTRHLVLHKIGFRSFPVLLALPLIFLACGGSSQYTAPSQKEVITANIAKDVLQNGLYSSPIEPTDQITTLDKKVVSFIKIADISGPHQMRWDWISPDGKLYTTTGDFPLSTRAGYRRDSITAWHEILVRDQPAAELPGKWKVMIFLDDKPLATNFFYINGVVQQARNKAFAVVIGISEYQHEDPERLPNLNYADDDAKAFQNALRKLGWSRSHIKTLINKEANRREIVDAIESFLSKAGPDDMILLYWSGHAYPDPENTEKIYLACYDTDINRPSTGYRMDRVRQDLEEHKAKHVVMIADTCHAGKLMTRGIGIAPYMGPLSLPMGWVFLGGADSDRLAIEHSSWSNGAFTHFLLKGMTGKADGFESVGPKDGVVTLGELRAYLEDTMPDETQRILGKARRPIINAPTGDPDIWNLSIELK
jgi:hypothetical protein